MLESFTYEKQRGVAFACSKYAVPRLSRTACTLPTQLSSRRRLQAESSVYRLYAKYARCVNYMHGSCAIATHCALAFPYIRAEHDQSAPALGTCVGSSRSIAAGPACNLVCTLSSTLRCLTRRSLASCVRVTSSPGEICARSHVQSPEMHEHIHPAHKVQ
jgi:hypothetical protein